MRLYVASSWRNPYYNETVRVVKSALPAWDVYDFRNPAPGNHGFAACDYPSWVSGTTDGWNEAMHEDEPALAWKLDSESLYSSDALLLVLPCGKSAHMELGWMAGAGKPVAVFAPFEFEPELMYGMAGIVTNDLVAALGYLNTCGAGNETSVEPSPVAERSEILSPDDKDGG